MTNRNNTRTDSPPVQPHARRAIAGRIAFILSILGVLVLAHLTYEHYTDSTTLACSDNGAVNCLKVTTSPWSEILGIPVAGAGLAYFLLMAVLCAPLPSMRRLGTLRVVGGVTGTLMVLWLIYVELFKVDAICLWCIGPQQRTQQVIPLADVEIRPHHAQERVVIVGRIHVHLSAPILGSGKNPQLRVAVTVTGSWAGP